MMAEQGPRSPHFEGMFCVSTTESLTLKLVGEKACVNDTSHQHGQWCHLVYQEEWGRHQGRSVLGRKGHGIVLSSKVRLQPWLSL